MNSQTQGISQPTAPSTSDSSLSGIRKTSVLFKTLVLKKIADVPPIQPPATWKYIFRAKTMFLLAKFNAPFLFLLIAYIVSAYLNGFTKVGLPGSTGKVIDAILGKSHDEFWEMIYGLLIKAIKSVIFYSMEQFTFNLLQQKIILNTRRRVCHAIVKAKAAHLRDPNLLATLQEDSKMVCKLATFKIFMQLFITGFHLHFRITKLFVISSSWTICVLIMQPTFTFISKTVNKLLSQKIEALDEKNKKTVKVFVEKIHGLVRTKINCPTLATATQKQLEALLVEDDAHASTKAVLNAILNAVTHGLRRLGEVIMLIWGSTLLIQNAITPGNFAVFIVKSVNILETPKALFKIFAELNASSESCKRFFEFIEQAEANEESGNESGVESTTASPHTMSKAKSEQVEEIGLVGSPALRKSISSTIIIKRVAETSENVDRKRHVTVRQVYNNFEDEERTADNKESKAQEAAKGKPRVPMLSDESDADESDDESKTTKPLKKRTKLQTMMLTRKKEFKEENEVRFRGPVSNSAQC